MAGYDPVRYEAVLYWPLREFLLARAAQVHAEIGSDLRHKQLMTALGVGRGKGGKVKMPNPPAWLRRPLA